MSRLSLPALLSLVACEQPREITHASPELAAVVEGQNQFAFDLLAAVSPEGNAFVSPFSIVNALGMTYAGAAGDTRAEMAEVLHLSVDDAVFHAQLGALGRDLAGDHHRPYTLRMANGLYGQEGMDWEAPFLDVCALDYGAPLEEVDFSADADAVRRRINRRVSRLTDGMIDEALRPGDISAATRLALTNAIYFEGDWATPFEPESTRSAPFTRGDGVVVTADLMVGSVEAGFMAGEGLSALRLPYEGDELSLLVLLPDDPGGLAALEASLSPSRVDGWVAAMEGGEVAVSLPRFSLRSRMSLAEILGDLGMPSAFDPGLADFSGMSTTHDLYIQDVIHEAVIELDEQGTRAAAFTLVEMRETSLIQVRQFTADHPFLFAIRDDLTGALLFVGRLDDPGSGGLEG